MTKLEAQRTREVLKAVRQVELRTRRLVEDRLAGQYHSVFKGRGMNFAEVREYVRGDEVRAIDWNVTARTGVPHVKTFTEERELTLLLMIDMSSSGAYGSGRSSKRELAAEAASALAFSAIRNNDKVGLLLFTDRVELYLPPKRGRAHILRIIREILFFEPRGRRTDLAAALDHANRVLRRRALAFLLSDFLLVGPIDESIAALRRKLKATNRRHDVVAVSVTDPRELQLPDVGIITLEDSETGEQIEIDTSKEKAREAYRRAADRYYAEIARCIRASGVDQLALSTGLPWLPALMAFFGRRQGRRAP
jgi:uncharacterized protein (DUF58 family)